ncbi:MAG: AbrB family transcriptional regulator [Euryarchaeota archaeon CG01_land_8_20_14_3_00_38_12]|nr:MAG: AbrB family transcriptional regulator [Euryarchaeota archaeon CG01_land_8_20_14_3_00_38_12]
MNEEIGMTKVSSKGQVVLPKIFRTKSEIKAGTLLAVTRTKNGLIVLKKITSPILKEDILTLKNVEKAWEEIEKGEFRKASKIDFIEELTKW